jgi:hypothetical protein
MESRNAELLQRIESHREVLLDFFRRFIRCPTPARRRLTSVSFWPATGRSAA